MFRLSIYRLLVCGRKGLCRNGETMSKDYIKEDERGLLDTGITSYFIHNKVSAFNIKIAETKTNSMHVGFCKVKNSLMLLPVPGYFP